MKTAKDAIYDKQKKWAIKHNISFNPKSGSPYRKDFVYRLEDNLFQPLSAIALCDFQNGRGNEVGTAAKPGDMYSLHSSSALACNFFDRWYGKMLNPLATFLGAPIDVTDMRFERTFPTGLKGTPPHLDVVLLGEKIKPFAIESKFSEPYGSDKSNLLFSGAYFPEGTGLWELHGLPRCQALVHDIQTRVVRFSRLDAPQLLKHILGMAKAHLDGFTLLYLWYDLPSPEASEHRAEIDRFAQAVGGDIDFREMTYQDLFSKITMTTGGEYIAYLADRYF